MAINTNSNVADINKCNADDLNEIKSVVNTNATALDNLTTQVNDKNIMTMELNTTFTLSANNTSYDITGFVLGSSLGTKLSFASNKITIGSGVTKIKVSFNAKVLSANTTRTFVYLTKNGTNISQEGAFPVASAQTITLGYSPRIMTVQQGDEFWLRCYGASGAKIVGLDGGTFVDTYLTIEVIE